MARIDALIFVESMLNFFLLKANFGNERAIDRDILLIRLLILKHAATATTHSWAEYDFGHMSTLLHILLVIWSDRSELKYKYSSIFCLPACWLTTYLHL